MKDPNCDYCPKCGKEVGRKGLCNVCKGESTIAVELTLPELKLIEYAVADVVEKSITDRVLATKITGFGQTSVLAKIVEAIAEIKSI